MTASGFEPGWALDISGGRARLTYDYGEHELSLPLLGHSREAQADVSVYRAGSGQQELLVRAIDEECIAPSGEPLPLTVEVRLGARTFRGCGKHARGRTP